MFRFIRLIHNAHITIRAESWASQVRNLANQFSAIDHDIRDEKYGSVDEIQRRVQATNGLTHSLWEEMKKGLDLKD